MKFHFLPVLAALACLPFPLDADYAADFDARAQLLLDWGADHYQPPGSPNYPGVATGYGDPGKYSWPKTVARLAKYGDDDPDANTWISNAATINTFHFYFPGLAKTLSAWPDSPQVAAKSASYLQRIIDSTHSSGLNYNIWTGEGTENHINMSRPPAYLIATLALDAGIVPATGQPTPAARKTQLKDWVLDWSKRTLEMGTGEWDSDQYGAYNVQGWLVLYDHADDPEVRDAARAVLDFYASTLALKYTQGLMAGPKQRGVPNSNGTSSTDYLCWLWFAASTAAPVWSGNDYLPSVMAATSSYRPPGIAVSLARKQLSRGVEYRNSKPSYLMTRPGEIAEIHYIGPHYTMSTAFDNYGGWTNASWAVVAWKAIIENNAGTPGVLWGNGGQKSITHPRGRNPYDQFVQHRNVLIQMTRVPSNAGIIAGEVAQLVGDSTFNANGWRTRFNADFQQRFGFNHPDNPVKDGAIGSVVSSNARRSTLYHRGFSRTTADDIVWLELDGTFVAVRSIRGAVPVTSGDLVYDSSNIGQLAGIVLEIGTTEDYADMAAFQSAILQGTSLDLSQRDAAAPRIVYTALNGDVIDTTFSTSGEWVEPDFDWNYGVTEQRIGFNTIDWIQPDWPTGEGHGRRAAWSVNGVAVDLETPWPVHGGPNLVQQQGILRLRDNTRHYTVDYSGALPVFTEGELEPLEIPSAQVTLPDGRLRISFPTGFGVIYRLETSESLAPGSWHDTGDALLVGDGEVMGFTRDLPGGDPARAFYRVVAE